MNSEEELLLSAAAAILIMKMKNQKPKKWSKRWLLNREQYSHVYLIKDLDEPNDFRNYLRMDEATYINLLNLVDPFIYEKQTQL